MVVLFAINILNFYDRHVPGALVEPMRKQWLHLNDSQIKPSRQRLHLDLCDFRPPPL